MLSWADFSQSLHAARRPMCCVLLLLVAGCTHRACLSSQAPEERILPPPDVAAPSALEDALPLPKVDSEKAHEPGEEKETPEPVSPKPGSVRGIGDRDHSPSQSLTLPDAITLAFRLQPRLRASLESINQA